MKRLACLALLAACTSNEGPAGDPSILAGQGPWLLGETNQVQIQWLPPVHCPTITDCESPPSNVLEVNSIECDGCSITNTYAGGVSGGGANIPAVATRDGAITITASLTYVPTGEHQTISTVVQGDHEIALGAECAWMWADQVEPSLEGNYEPTFPCEPTRRPDQAVLLTPFVQTAGGVKLYPFELEAPTTSSPEPNARTFATITTSVAPDRWTFSSAVYTTTAADAVTLTAPLSSGGTGTTTVTLPTVCDPARPCVAGPHANDRR
jgi:hypothetical protein